MELKEIIAIFQKESRFFFGIILLCVLLAFVWQKNQKPLLQATLLLNIGRTNIEQSSDFYTYDSFYRLQADERFADTVVRWLASPRVVSDIFSSAHLNAEVLGTKDLKKTFSAARLSSQMIEVTYTHTEKKVLEELSQSVVKVLEGYTKKLNQSSSEKNWFVVIGSEPVIRDARVGMNVSLLVGFLIGVFVAFWSVLFRHYLSKK